MKLNLFISMALLMILLVNGNGESESKSNGAEGSSEIVSFSDASQTNGEGSSETVSFSDASQKDSGGSSEAVSFSDASQKDSGGSSETVSFSDSSQKNSVGSSETVSFSDASQTNVEGSSDAVSFSDTSRIEVGPSSGGDFNPRVNFRDVGEPKVIYYTGTGYSASSSDPISIKKVITRDESGKGVGNRLRVDVEIDYSRRMKEPGGVMDIDIYEIVDPSLSIDDCIDKKLVNFKKINSLEGISILKFDLSLDQILKDNAVGNNVTTDCINVLNNQIFAWDGLLKANIEDIGGLSKYLRENFSVTWIDPEHINISKPVHKISDGKRIESFIINDTQEGDNWIEFQIDDPIKKEGTVLMNISGERSYNLKYNLKGDGRISVYDWNVILILHADEMSSRDRLFYWYYVKPKHSGVFNAESIIRINDYGWRGYPDISYPLIIEVYNPDLKFEVKPILQSNKVYADSPFYNWLWFLNEKLNIVYNIKFTGDASDAYRRRINVKPDESSNNYYYIDDGGRTQRNLEIPPLNFSQKSYNSVNISVAYAQSGVYRIPGIWIEGQLYDFGETITIDTPLTRSKDGILFFMAIFGFLLGLIFNKELKKALKGPAYFVKKLIHKNGGEKEEKVNDIDASARDEAAKEMGRLIIEALERGGKEKKPPL